MKEETNRIYTVVALIGVATLVLSCFVGALAGGLAGFVVGRSQAEAVAEKTFDYDLEYLPESDDKMPPHDLDEHPLFPPGFEEHLPSEMMPPGMGGAFVVEVVKDSPADEAGLEAGDFIIAVDRTSIDVDHPLPDVIGQYEPGDRVTVRVWREGQEESLRVKLSAHPDDPRRAYLGVYFEMIGLPHFEVP